MPKPFLDGQGMRALGDGQSRGGVARLVEDEPLEGAPLLGLGWLRQPNTINLLN
jgi:hypothetical protein